MQRGCTVKGENVAYFRIKVLNRNVKIAVIQLVIVLPET